MFVEGIAKRGLPTGTGKTIKKMQSYLCVLICVLICVLMRVLMRVSLIHGDYKEAFNVNLWMRGRTFSLMMDTARGETNSMVTLWFGLEGS